MQFRPRFSVRALAIVVTMICVYFGAWEATKKYGVVTKTQFAPAPLVVVDEVEEFHATPIRYSGIGGRIITSEKSRQYYVWLFGPRFRLPFKTEVPEPELSIK